MIAPLSKTFRTLLISTLFAAALFALLPAPQARAAALTEAQIQAILNLLSSFDASPAVVAATEAALRGTTTQPQTLPAPSITFAASHSVVTIGGSSTLKWSVTDATRCALQTSDGLEWVNVGTSGSEVVTPPKTAVYRLWCVNDDGSDKDDPASEKSVTVVVEAAPSRPAPSITFTTSPTEIFAGEKSTLHWYTNNATRCVLQASDGSEWADAGTFGGKVVYPKKTTTYKLWCANEDGSGKDGPSSEKSVTVTVKTPAVACASVLAPEIPTPGPDLKVSPTSVSQGCASVAVAWNGGPAAYQCYVYRSDDLGSDRLVWNGVKGLSYIDTLTRDTTITLRCLDTSGGYIYATPRSVKIDFVESQSVAPRTNVLAEALAPHNLMAAAATVATAPAALLVDALTELFVSLGVGR